MESVKFIILVTGSEEHQPWHACEYKNELLLNIWM